MLGTTDLPYHLEFTCCFASPRRQSPCPLLGVIDDALVFAAKSLGLDLTPEKRAALVESYLKLKDWPRPRLTGGGE